LFTQSQPALPRRPPTPAPFYCAGQEHKKLSYRPESKLKSEFNHGTASLDGATGAGSSAVEASIEVTSRAMIDPWFHRVGVC
jgi:hypothetical protein